MFVWHVLEHGGQHGNSDLLRETLIKSKQVIASERSERGNLAHISRHREARSAVAILGT